MGLYKMWYDSLIQTSQLFPVIFRELSFKGTFILLHFPQLDKSSSSELDLSFNKILIIHTLFTCLMFPPCHILQTLSLFTHIFLRLLYHSLSRLSLFLSLIICLPSIFLCSLPYLFTALLLSLSLFSQVHFHF